MTKLTGPCGHGLLVLLLVSELLVCFDAAPTTGAWRWTDRGLEVRIRPFWYGTRKYPKRDGGQFTVLRRRSQVMAPAHLRRFARLTLTDGHPRVPGSRAVFLSAKAEPGSPTPFDPEVVWYPHELFYVGSLGDSWAEVDSPIGRTAEFLATFTVKKTADKIRGGDLEVSTGHLMHYITAAESVVDGEEVVAEGMWKNPVTGRLEPFDVEGLSDHEDPRIPDELRDYIGPNHCAGTVGAGRGGPGVRVLPLGGEASRVALDEDELRAGLKLISMTRPATSPDPCAYIVAHGGPDAMATMIWVGETPSAATYGRLSDLLARHVDGHPERETILTGLVVTPDTGQSSEVEPPGDAPQVDPSGAQPIEDTEIDMADTPDYQKMYTELLAAAQQKDAVITQKDQEIAALKAKIAEADGGAAAAKKTAEDAVKAAELEKTAKDAAEKKAGESQAALDALERQTKPLLAKHLEDTRDAALAVAAGSAQLDAIKAVKIDEKTPFPVALDQLEALGVKGYFEAHPDEAPTALEERIANRHYVSPRFDELRRVTTQPRRGSTFDSLRPEQRGSGTANDSATDGAPDTDDLQGRLNKRTSGT